MRKDDTGEAKRVVEPDDSARQLIVSAEDDFPDVFSTSRMVALMETAAARAMRTSSAMGSCQLAWTCRSVTWRPRRSALKSTRARCFSACEGNCTSFACTHTTTVVSSAKGSTPAR